MPRLPKACWPAHLGANSCHPFLLLCHLGCHKLAQLFHGESCQGPSSGFDLLEDIGQLGPVKRRGLSSGARPALPTSPPPAFSRGPVAAGRKIRSARQSALREARRSHQSEPGCFPSARAERGMASPPPKAAPRPGGCLRHSLVTLRTARHQLLQDLLQLVHRGGSMEVRWGLDSTQAWGGRQRGPGRPVGTDQGSEAGAAPLLGCRQSRRRLTGPGDEAGVQQGEGEHPWVSAGHDHRGHGN